MRIFQLSFIILLIAPTLNVYSQNELVKITIRVFSQENKQSIPNAKIVSYHDVESYGVERDGEWQLQVVRTDSFKIVALGYESVTLVLPDSVSNYDVFRIELLSKNYMLDEVTIHQDFNLHLPKDVRLGEAEPFNKYKHAAPPKTPIGNSCTYMNPVFTIKNMVGKKSRTRRKLYKSLMNNKQESSKKRELMTKDIIQEISYLEGEQLQRFIVYCNIHIRITENDNESIVKLRINNALQKFLQEEGEE